jgi:hypothetical protein
MYSLHSGTSTNKRFYVESMKTFFNKSLVRQYCEGFVAVKIESKSKIYFGDFHNKTTVLRVNLPSLFLSLGNLARFSNYVVFYTCFTHVSKYLIYMSFYIES